MCAIMKPVVPLCGFLFFDMIIPSSSGDFFCIRNILNALLVSEGKLCGMSSIFGVWEARGDVGLWELSELLELRDG